MISAGSPHPVETWSDEFGGFWTPEPLQPDGSRYPSMGPVFVAWAQTFLRLDAGGGRIRFDPWQKELMRRAMLYDPETLLPIARDIVVVGPEGIGKSAMYGMVATFQLGGPCLPPVEAPRMHPAPKIPIVSFSKDLTDAVHDSMKAAVEHGPLEGLVTVEVDRVFRTGQTSHCVDFLAASGMLKQGGRPRPSVFVEELHAEEDAKSSAVKTFRTVVSKVSKVPGTQTWIITNPDENDPETILGQLVDRMERALTGENDDPMLLGVHYTPKTRVQDLDDPDEFRRGLRECTPASWLEIEEIAAKYEVKGFSKTWTRRFSLGEFVSADEAVFDDGVYESIAVPAEYATPPPPGTTGTTAGFDGSLSDDSTALIGTTAEGYQWPIGAWERPPNVRRWRVPGHEVEEAVEQFMEDYPDAWLACDDRGWETEVDTWEATWPGRVVRRYQQHGARCWSRYRKAVQNAADSVAAGTVAPGELSHSGAPILLRHARNSRERQASRGSSKAVLAKRAKSRRIDAFVAATYSWDIHIAVLLDSGDTATEDEWREALGVTQEET